jgi:hypothetical protein
MDEKEKLKKLEKLRMKSKWRKTKDTNRKRRRHP